jgi:hypothetical protein
MVETLTGKRPMGSLSRPIGEISREVQQQMPIWSQAANTKNLLVRKDQPFQCCRETVLV